jgi:glycosyltransferase involved in cell wall biosynthesis
VPGEAVSPGLQALPRVLQVMAGARVGGAEEFFERLVTALHRRGLAQLAVIRGERGRAARLRAAGVDTLELAFGGMLDLATRPALARAIEGFRPDLVLSWMSRATQFCPRGNYLHLARLGGYYDLKYYRLADHLIANTPAILDYILAEGWPEERASYLPNFVDGTRAAPLDRADFATPASAPLVLALGRLHANKAFDVALNALARMPDVHLWIAGEGPEKRALQRLAVHLGVERRVRFLGWRRDVPALLASANLLICPSRHEPLGNVVIEAWAHGVPVVASLSDGPKALIQPEATGLLVPVDDVPALGDAMARVLAGPELAHRLAVAGHRAYQAAHSEAVVAPAFLDLFNRLIASPPVRVEARR